MKETLKVIKLNEGTISMILGAAVVITVGLLLINYFRNSRVGEPTVGQGGAEEQRMMALPTEHAVLQGETLWSIAEKYYTSGYNWIDIARENKIHNSNHIVVGQKLTIPKVEARVPKLQAMPAGKNVDQANPINDNSYTIVKGDNLWKISVRAYGDGYGWLKIAQSNKLKNPNLIYPENTLNLPR